MIMMMVVVVLNVHLSGQDMKRTRNSRVNQVMYIASKISIVSFESEIGNQKSESFTFKN